MSTRTKRKAWDPVAWSVVRLLEAAGLEKLWAMKGILTEEPWDPEHSATILVKGANALGAVLGSFEADADYLLQAREPLEATGYGTRIGYMTNTPLLFIRAGAAEGGQP